MHGMDERYDQDGRRQDVGQECGVPNELTTAKLHPSNRKAGERANGHAKQHGGYAEKYAVAELMPEMFQIPMILRPDRTEAAERRLLRPKAASELVTLVIERNEHHVVDW